MSHSIVNDTKKRKASNRLKVHQVNEVTKDFVFSQTQDGDDGEKRSDQRRRPMTEEDSEWLKSLIDPDWNEIDENKKYKGQDYSFTRTQLICIHRGAELLGHVGPWTVGASANVQDLVESLKKRDVALWKVHDAGAPVTKGRKSNAGALIPKDADIEVVVVDDEVDDKVEKTPTPRRSKRVRNDS